MEPIVAPCGNDCAACPRYQATRRADPRALAEVAVLWHRFGWRERVVSAGEIACRGCCATHECRHGIAGCAAERGVKTCGECPGFAGCERVGAALSRTGAFAAQCRASCAPGLFAVLERAFFRKRENLEAARDRSQNASARPPGEGG